MNEQGKGSNFITVGCKLPHGMHLDIQPEGKPRTRHTLKGTNSSKVIGGFGLTEIPKDFWEAWLALNKDIDPVSKGFVWAYPTMEGAEKKAIEKANLRHGMEPIDPQEDPRRPKGVKTDDGKDE